MRRFCWHDWSKWKTYVWVGQVHDRVSGKTLDVSKTKQARMCAKCGKEVHRTVDGAGGSQYDTVTAIPQLSN